MTRYEKQDNLCYAYFWNNLRPWGIAKLLKEGTKGKQDWQIQVVSFLNYSEREGGTLCAKDRWKRGDIIKRYSFEALSKKDEIRELQWWDTWREIERRIGR